MNTGCIQEIIHAFTNFPSISYTLEKGEKLALYAIISKGWAERKTLSVFLNDEYASCDIHLLFLGKQTDTFYCDVMIQSQARATHSSISIRSLLTGNSLLDMNGTCVLAKNSEQSDLFFSSHALLLSSNAQAKIIPSLEVEVDDVKAAHAATIGRIDDEELFFLQSRGFSKKEANTISVNNFFSANMAKIPENYKELFTQSLDTFLNKI